MAKKGGSGSESTSPNAYTVFIDTNLDTHFAMIFSDEDTVRDFKQKIMNEHAHCFPNMGEITIIALKIKRKGCFYHLADSMPIKNAFDGVNKAWFLYVDAASNQVVPAVNQTYLEPDASNLPKRLGIMDGPLAETERNNFQLDVFSKRVSVSVDSQLPQVGRSNARSQLFPPQERNHTKSVTNKRSGSEELEKQNLFSEGNEAARAQLEHKNHNSRKRKEMHLDDIYEETPLLELAAKKKRTNDNMIEDVNGYQGKDPLKEHDSGTFSSKKTFKPENIMPQKSVEETLPTGSVAKKKHKNEKKIEHYSHVEDPMSENDVGVSLSRKETSDPEKLLYEDPLKENDAGTSISRKETSEEKVFSEYSLEDKEKTTDVELSVKPVEKSVYKKRIKKKKSVSLYDEVSAALLSKENVVQETSKEALENNHKEFDVVVSPMETALSERVTNFSATSEKEKNGDQVQEVGEESMPPSSLPNDPNGVLVAKTAVGEVDGVSRLAMELDEDGGSKVESEKDVPEKAVASRGNTTKRAKKRKAASEKVLTTPLVEESDNLTREIKPSAHDAGVPDSDNVGHDSTDKNEEREKTLPQIGDPKLISAEASKSVVQDEAEKNIKDGVVPSNLLYTSDLIKTGDPSDKRTKKSKKSTKATGLKLVNGAEDAILLRLESDKAFDNDHPGDETKTEGAVVSRTVAEMNIGDIIPSYKLSDVSGVVEAQDRPSDKRKKAKKIKKSDAPIPVSTSGVVNAPSPRPDKEADKVSANEADSLQITKSIGAQETSDLGDYKIKRKSVKTRVSKPKSHLDPPTEELAVHLGDPIHSTDLKEENAPKKKKSRSQKPSLVKQSDSTTEVGKDNGDIGSSQIPLHTLEYNVEEGPHEENFKGDDYLENGWTDETNSHMEAPNIEGDEVNFKEYFVPTPDHHEVVAPATLPGDKEVQVKASDKKLKANKKMKKVNLHSVDTVASVQKSLSSNEDQGYKKKRQGATTDTTPGPLLEHKQSKPAPQTNVKASVTAGGGMIEQRDNAESLPSKASKAKRGDASGTTTPVDSHLVRSSAGANSKPSTKVNSVVRAESSVNTERSVQRVQKNKGYGELESQANLHRGDARKSSGDKIGEILNISNSQKSLLATSNTIFEDSSSESTQDDGGLSNSETSTRSPSDYSSSSELSKGENDVNLDSPGNGSYGGRIMENGSRSVIKSQSRGMPLDMIFRSSRSYRKAKLTASQSQLEDTESQPIEFVLDSQL